MDYEFRSHAFDGSLQALFSMEHEALGRWLTDELGRDKDKLSNLLQVISDLQLSRLHQFQLIGADLTVEMDNEQVLIVANVAASDDDSSLSDSMNIYDAESRCSCGLEDFQQVLLSWQAFLAEQG